MLVQVEPIGTAQPDLLMRLGFAPLIRGPVVPDRCPIEGSDTDNRGPSRNQHPHSDLRERWSGGDIVAAFQAGDPVTLVPLLYCLRRGLGLKDGPGKRKSGHCHCLAEAGVHPLAIGQDRPSTLGPVGEGRSDSRVLHLSPTGPSPLPGGWPTARG